MLKILFCFTLTASISFTTFSQGRLVIDDRTGMLTGEFEMIVSNMLREDSIVYSSVVDYKERCLYYFTELNMVEEDVVLTVRDCLNDLLGSRNLGSRILSSSVQEQGFLVSNAIMDIVSYPGKYGVPAIAGADSSREESEEVVREEGPQTNEHDSRYFFAPSAYNLKKGELYYNTVYFLLHDIQYGVHDRFSVGIGTTIIGLPIYITPKISIPLGKRSAIAVGDLLLFGTYGTNAMGNLAYGIFSTGGPDGNISLGAGHLATNESDITGKTSSLVTNLSAMVRLSPYIFLLTENYVMSININREAQFSSYDPVTGWSEYFSEDFIQRSTFWYGIAGARIVTKKTDFISWQFGLTYVANFPGEIPRKYNSWETDAKMDMNLIAFPTISFTVKFGRKF
jgi:hypothetical protein